MRIRAQPVQTIFLESTSLAAIVPKSGWSHQLRCHLSSISKHHDAMFTMSFDILWTRSWSRGDNRRGASSGVASDAGVKPAVTSSCGRHAGLEETVFLFMAESATRTCQWSSVPPTNRSQGRHVKYSEMKGEENELEVQSARRRWQAKRRSRSHGQPPQARHQSIGLMANGLSRHRIHEITSK